MIEFHILGRIDLADPDRPGCRRLMQQPKRLALLAYLAMPRPGTFHRRDTLLGIFWPERDAEHASHSLSQALYFLRSCLGADTLISRGAAEVGLAPERIWCDAAAFDNAIEYDNPAMALELYRGELLEGLYISGSPAFEHWYDRECDRLHRRATGAARMLSNACLEAGDFANAVHWTRRELSLSPYDEGVLRRLIRSLDAAGDHAAAIREYATFADNLARELELETSPDTDALIDSLRAPKHAAPAAAAASPQFNLAEAEQEMARTPAFAGPEFSPPPSRRLPSPQHPFRSLTKWGRRHLWSTAFLLVLSVLVGTWGVLGWPAADGPSYAEASPVRIVVLPFRYHGGPERAYLGEGTAHLLAMNLDRAGVLHSVDPGAVFAFLHSREMGGNASLGAVTIAERFGAAFYATGSITEVSGRIRVSAAVYDANDRMIPVARADTAGRAEDVFALVDRITAELLTEMPGAPGGRLARVAAVTTESLAAFEQYLRGESLLRSGQYDSAIVALQRAVAEDSTFALAYHRLSFAAEWSPRPELMRRAAERAVRHSDRLSTHGRRLLDASLAWRRGEAEKAERLYRSILADYPNDIEATFQLAEVLFHYNPLRGRTIEESRLHWHRVLAARPHDLYARLHLARLASALYDTASLESLAAGLLSPEFRRDRRALQISALHALSAGRVEDQARIVNLLDSTGDAVQADIWYIVAFARDPVRSRQFLEMLVRPARDPELRAIGHTMIAHAELASGRLTAARRAFEAAARLNPRLALSYRALTALLPFLRTPERVIEQLRRRLETSLRLSKPSASGRPVDRPARAGRAGPDLPAYRIHDGLRLAIRDYLLGLLSARLGNFSAARRYASRLDNAREGTRDPALRRDLARGVRAFAAMRQGDPERGLALLEGLEGGATFEEAFLSAFRARAYERFLHAELLFELGRYEEALARYACMAQVSPYEIIYLAPSHLRRGRIHEILGNTEEAVVHYTRALEQWRRSGTRRPVIAHVKQRLTELH